MLAKSLKNLNMNLTFLFCMYSDIWANHNMPPQYVGKSPTRDDTYRTGQTSKIGLSRDNCRASLRLDSL